MSGRIEVGADLAELLKDARKAPGLVQRSKDLGASRQTISKLENGTQTRFELDKLAVYAADLHLLTDGDALDEHAWDDLLKHARPEHLNGYKALRRGFRKELRARKRPDQADPLMHGMFHPGQPDPGAKSPGRSRDIPQTAIRPQPDEIRKIPNNPE